MAYDKTASVVLDFPLLFLLQGQKAQQTKALSDVLSVVLFFPRLRKQRDEEPSLKGQLENGE